MHRFLLPPQRTPFLFLLAAAVLGVIVLLLKEPSPEDRLRSECDLLQQKITDTNAELDAVCRSTTTLLGQDSTANWRSVSDGLVSLEKLRHHAVGTLERKPILDQCTALG
ncbi:MAG: hypothetical protein IPP33_10510 [Flavobacteriales bacterium]|nr:hypothetical protein [Flavobacteriales bacterium]